VTGDEFLEEAIVAVGDELVEKLLVAQVGKGAGGEQGGKVSGKVG
jgi:hypothetical protein